jgi:hypothetical protein
MKQEIQKIFGYIWMEKSYYLSNKNLKNIHSELQSIFGDNSLDVNLSGKFKAGNTDKFVVTPKWSFFVFKGGEQDVAYLNGTIKTTVDNKTIIEIKVRPNIFFPLFSLILLASNFDGKLQGTEDVLAQSTITIIIPIALLTLSYYLKKSLKDRFVKKLNLNSTDDQFDV